MPDSPLISIVMSVYNAADSLVDTLDSILSQEGVELEFIVVNDGSTDVSLQILQGYVARDKRLRIIDQDNTGLSRALIRGCSEANGEYIARQDGGDISLSGRLQIQKQILDENDSVVMVSCGTRFIGPEGELLREVIQTNKSASEGLHQTSLAEIAGPSHHGSTMFRKADYQAVGGYRVQFQVAQDLDLWTRMVERGQHFAIQEIFYQAAVAHNAISNVKRDQQLATAELILECTRRRHEGLSEDVVLEQVELLKSTLSAGKDARGKDSEFFYFLGSCLRPSEPVKARQYYRRALRCNPLHFKAMLRLLQTW